MEKHSNSKQILEPIKNAKPLVSVCVVTYNQEQYIAQNLESILAQKTNFPFEIVIGEDVSKDKTRAICEKYAQQYPSVIRLLDTPKNLGAMQNSLRTFRESRGEYIALLEGDDYWIDDKKLQKQVDALKKDSKRTICFTGRKDFDEENNVFVTVNGDRGDNCFYPKDFAQDTFFHTSTAMFRNPKNENWLTKLQQFTIGDRPMFILLMMESGGYAYKLKDICSVFRLNNNSSFTPTKPLQRSILVAKMYTEMKAAFPELSIDFNKHLNVSDYFILRDAYRNKDKILVKQLIRNILNRRTRMSGFGVKLKAFLHYFI
jgi:glycosyltransferase involved in cell wall biosynthesis